MATTVIISIISIYFLFLKIRIKNISIEDKTEKATTFLSKFLMIAPLIAAIVFTILFTTLLHGRLEERISHALIVFMLWMYATSFYVDILKHYSS